MTTTRPLNKASILGSIPKSVIIGSTTYTAHVEYADRGKAVSEILKTYPLAVTLRYYNDRPDTQTTPGNRQFGRTVSGSDLKYTIGQKRLVTLSMNIHAKDTASLPADKLVTGYIGDDSNAGPLLTWLLRDLPVIVEVVDDTGISDISFLETNIERRQVDILLRYDRTYEKTVKTIDTVDDPTVSFS